MFWGGVGCRAGPEWGLARDVGRGWTDSSAGGDAGSRSGKGPAWAVGTQWCGSSAVAREGAGCRVVEVRSGTQCRHAGRVGATWIVGQVWSWRGGFRTVAAGGMGEGWIGWSARVGSGCLGWSSGTDGIGLGRRVGKGRHGLSGRNWTGLSGKERLGTSGRRGLDRYVGEVRDGMNRR